VAIIGCSSDNISANAKFAADNHFAFPLLSDTDLVVALKYGAAASAGDGKARRIAALIDERGHVAKVWDPAGTGKFPAQVLAELKKDELR